MTLHLFPPRPPGPSAGPLQAGPAPRGPERGDGGAPLDGWVGTRELPGYRAGCVVVKLDELPEVAPDHLYFDLLLLDGSGRPQQTHSGPCQALARAEPLDQRSRFVRVVAELVRHAPCEDRGLAAIAPALDFIREGGIEPERLATALQLLDNASSESAVIASLNDVLKLSLGEDEAHRALSDVVVKAGARLRLDCRRNGARLAGRSLGRRRRRLPIVRPESARRRHQRRWPGSAGLVRGARRRQGPRAPLPA